MEALLRLPPVACVLHCSILAITVVLDFPVSAGMQQSRQCPQAPAPLPPAMSKLARRSTILPLDKDMFGAQACIKGGIGLYVSQGLAKRGFSCNPNNACFSSTITQKTLRDELRSLGLHIEDSHSFCEVFASPAYEYEKNQKDDVFRAASR